MRVFVTGGTGLLGNTVARKLLSTGDSVVALVRSPPDPDVFRGLDVELVHSPLVDDADGDSQLAASATEYERSHTEPSARQCVEGSDSVEEPNGRSLAESDSAERPLDDGPRSDDGAIEAAVASCDAVIHAAAMIHLGWNQVEESMLVNRDGTRRIVQACLKHQKKLAYIGTVNAIALGSPKTLADENTPLGHAGGQVECAYVKSKRASLNVVRDAVAAGLNAVILHPGFMLGPWDWKPSSGRMMLEVGKGWKPIAPSGGCSLCDSRDVADAVITALKSDCQPGREFILAGHNLTYRTLWTEMAVRMGKRPPIRAAGPGMEFLAGTFGDLFARITGKEPDFNSAGVMMSSQYHWYTSRRAQSELGYQIRDASETLDDAARWIRDRFILPHSDADG